MRIALVVMLLIALIRPASAAEPLTPEQAAEGWIALFDGESTFGWKTTGDVDVADGILHVGGDEPGTVELTTRLGPGELYLEVSEPSLFSGQLEFVDAGGTIGHGLVAHQNRLVIEVNQEAIGTEGTVNTTPEGMTVDESTISVTQSTVPLRIVVDQPARAQVKAVRFKPAGLEPIFNGENLDGWQPIPDRQSVFSVTDDGELSIKNGPGDLQTEAEWADFVLQLDIQTRGEHLNSGVFFRGTPGRFWSGFESQIRNQWEGDDRTKPVDFGTGGLYGRQPARRVVANDGEWFTKTVIAQGPHVAIWVNGYQVVDFTDDRGRDGRRRRNRNARGSIGLQGHDPTTDLLFRNVRVASLETPSGNEE